MGPMTSAFTIDNSALDEYNQTVASDAWILKSRSINQNGSKETCMIQFLNSETGESREFLSESINNEIRYNRIQANVVQRHRNNFQANFQSNRPPNLARQHAQQHPLQKAAIDQIPIPVGRRMKHRQVTQTGNNGELLVQRMLDDGTKETWYVSTAGIVTTMPANNPAMPANNPMPANTANNPAQYPMFFDRNN